MSKYLLVLSVLLIGGGTFCSIVFNLRVIGLISAGIGFAIFLIYYIKHTVTKTPPMYIGGVFFVGLRRPKSATDRRRSVINKPDSVSCLATARH